jgi:hypothetical protein
MQTRIVQVQPQPWPSGYGEVVAVLDLDLDALAERYALLLYEGTDNLDDYRAAAIQLPSGRRVGLLRHAGAPSDELELYADAHDDPDAATRELLNALELPMSTCSWLRQSVPASAGRPVAER